MSSRSQTSSSPEHFEFDSKSRASNPPSSTAASSPSAYGQSEFSAASSEAFDIGVPNDDSEGKDDEPELEDTETSRRLTRLQFVLEKSAVYSSILKERMDQDKQRQLEALKAQKQVQAKGSGKAKPISKSKRNTKKRTLEESNASDDDTNGKGGKRKKGLNGRVVTQDSNLEMEDEPPVFEQPKLITGAKLKPYQLEGLQWMVSLDQNGISGILADEMGLGKTLQTIAFSAYLREHHNFKPFLIVCPLSVLHNWYDEYQKFAPSIPVCIYHGTPAERADLRSTVMTLHKPKPLPKPAKKGKPKGKSKTKIAKTSSQSPQKGVRRSNRARRVSEKIRINEIEESENENENEPEIIDIDADDDVVLDGPIDPLNGDDDALKSFPIVLTTYEMIIRDRSALSHYDWGYIVVDEGHRLKNLDCTLMREIKKYHSAGRMILTGTPLHNNLAELWSLLNFILPDIFDDVDSFQEWFNLPSLQNTLPNLQSSKIISSLHAILKPFLLRRLKSDVETSLPPKKEYVLYAPLSIRQREAYEMVLAGSIRGWLIRGGTGGEGKKNEKVEEAEKHQKEKEDKPRQLRKRKGGRKNYAVDGDDDEYFKMLERDEVDERGVKTKEDEEEQERIGREHQHRAKVKQINNMKLQNAVMQLRKVCSHPFLFDWPLDSDTNQPVLGEELVHASGKMMVLDRLLRELFKRGHKVLLFSQFTTMLDIIEDWATEHMNWPICRIDGSSGPLERRQEMNRFQNGGNSPSAPKLFLLSTRAGGLGINLVAADTVIFYDQDWNPQMDAQAQDRAHRIGQTKPVLIYRLVSAHTIETKIMQRATEKRKLEALVIAKGKFKMPAVAAKRQTMAEMAASLLRLEGEKIDVIPDTKEGRGGVISDAALEMLLDRSDEVFNERGKGWSSNNDPDAQGAADESGPAKTAFAVYEAPKEEGNDALAKMFGEEIPE